MIKRQQILVRDISSSTTINNDCPNGLSRADYMQEMVYEVAMAQFNRDENARIDYGHFSSKGKELYLTDINQDQFIKILKDKKVLGGMTYGAILFQKIFEEYLRERAEYEKKGQKCPYVTLIAFVDGDFNDRSDLATVFTNFALKLRNKFEFKVCFVQIGKDVGAGNYLDWLDNDDGKGLELNFDIIDTKRSEWLVEHGAEALLDNTVTEEV